MSVPVFIAEDLAGTEIVLAGPEGRHAAAVRRMRVGERIDLTDGAGSVAEGVVVQAGKESLTIEVLARRRVPAPRPRLIVVQGLPKGDRGELAVEMMTEAGVDVVVPWSASRCVTQWKAERAAKGLAKWRSTAREAGKQARRAHLPEVAELASTAEVAGLLAGAALGLVLHEEAEGTLSNVALPADGDIVLVVGPEGGISDEEVAAFTAAGAVSALLGPTVLRTSTAGVAALA